MKRILLSLSITILLLQGIIGQTDTMIVNIKEVVVMENLIQSPLALAPSNIEIITADQVRSNPVKTIQGLLQYSKGVDIRQRGPMGVQADVSIRGGSFDQVVVLVDGIRMSDPQTGHHMMNLPVDLSIIDHIEVYKGPSSRVFGQNALAGAVNIVTKIPDHEYIRAEARAGDWGLFGTGIASSFMIGSSKHYFSAGRDRSSGYRYNTDFRINNFYYRSEIRTGLGRISLTAGMTARDFGANGFYASPDYTDQYERVTTSLAAIEFTPKINNFRIRIKNRAWLRTNADEYIFLRDDPSYYRNLHLNNNTGFESSLTWNNRAGISGLGFEINSTGITSNRLGDHSRLSSGIFAEHRFLLSGQKLILKPGVQINWYSDFGTSFLPGIDAGYRLAQNLMIYSGIGYTYRIPTYNDLYYEDPVNAGNPDLKPEYAVSAEAGIRFNNTRGLSANASLFRRHGFNIIDRIKYSDADRWMPENISSTRVSGLETGFTIDPSRIRDMSWISNVSLGYTWLFTELDESPVPYSKFAYENLRNHVTGSIKINWPGNLYQVVTFRYCNRVNLEDYAVTDTRIGYSAGMFSFYADITNIFSRSYRETNLVTLPGRWFSAGASIEIPVGPGFGKN